VLASVKQLAQHPLPPISERTARVAAEAAMTSSDPNQ
jgi:hypothetical protein